MKTKLNREAHLTQVYFSFSAILALLLLWSCGNDDDGLSPLRQSEKTVINTRPPTFVATDSAKLAAEILEVGPNTIQEGGFILSHHAEPTPENGNLIRLSGVGETGPYDFVAKNLHANQPYYYRFYVKANNELLYGATHSFTTNGISIKHISYSSGGETDRYEGSIGNQISILGNNFSSIPSENIVKFGSTPATVTYVWASYPAGSSNERSLTLRVPENVPAGLHEVTVTRAGQTVAAPEPFRVLPGKWRELNHLPFGLQSSGAQYPSGAFQLNGKGYIAGLLPYLPISLYEYAPGTDTWTKLGIKLNSNLYFLAAFGLKDKAYISASFYTYDQVQRKPYYQVQLHQVDPITGTQAEKQPFPIRYSYSNITLTQFTMGEYAYMGGGSYAIDSWGNRAYRHDFYKYDPTADTWIRIADFPGTSTENAVSFVIGGLAYLVVPTHNQQLLPEVWAYDPAANRWSRKSDFPGLLKYNAGGFSLGSKGYVVGGAPPSLTTTVSGRRAFWEYDPAKDTWQKVANFEGSKEGVKCFVLGGKAYAIQHQSSSSSFVWEFTPAQ